ncbi:hypothetical protein LMG28727_01223 [Paraburkholderia kirstenboschensis]|nr:hypothetical protein LMG28727_01223 [Paraburkholderia kirstenboschensis]
MIPAMALRSDEQNFGSWHAGRDAFTPLAPPRARPWLLRAGRA